MRAKVRMRVKVFLLVNKENKKNKRYELPLIALKMHCVTASAGVDADTQRSIHEVDIETNRGRGRTL